MIGGSLPAALAANWLAGAWDQSPFAYIDSPIAATLEEIALRDDYFISKKLYPNVDFYSGVILSAIGFPTTMFTVLFAIGRLPGWIAHWKEMMEDPTTKIGRPRQIYTGATAREYVPIEQRNK